MGVKPTFGGMLDAAHALYYSHTSHFFQIAHLQPRGGVVSISVVEC